MSDYPEHEKLKALEGQNNVIGDFITWMLDNELIVCTYDDKMKEFSPLRWPVERFLAEYFSIDQAALEREKNDMLDEIRRAAAA